MDRAAADANCAALRDPPSSGCAPSSSGRALATAGTGAPPGRPPRLPGATWGGIRQSARHPEPWDGEGAMLRGSREERGRAGSLSGRPSFLTPAVLFQLLTLKF